MGASNEGNFALACYTQIESNEPNEGNPYLRPNQPSERGRSKKEKLPEFWHGPYAESRQWSTGKGANRPDRCPRIDVRLRPSENKKRTDQYSRDCTRPKIRYSHTQFDLWITSNVRGYTIHDAPSSITQW
ncbi:MAG: hypothetical protein NVS4B2_19940 [Chloroflexota bacterium]